MQLIFILTLLGMVPTPALAADISSYTVEYSTTTAPLVLQAYATKYGINVEEFTAVAKCESRFNASAWNRRDPNGGSKGVFQFQPATFAHYSKKIGATDVWDPFHNIETAAYMFQQKQQKQWSCYKLLYGANTS